MKKHVITILCSLLFIGILITLFFKVVLSSSRDQQKFLMNIGEISQLSSELNVAVLESYSGLTKHYDDIVSITQRLDAKVESLVRFCNEKEEILKAESQVLRLAMDEKVRGIETFKTQHSVFRNSRTYFLTTNEGLFQDSHKYKDPFKQALLDINWLGYSFIKSKSKDLHIKMTDYIKKFKSQYRPDEMTKEKLDVLSLHGEIFLKTDLMTRKSVEQSTTHDVNVSATKMEEIYLKDQKIIRNHNIIYQSVMMGLSLFLFIYTISIFVKLIRIMENLESRVKIRTKELEESNELVKTQQKSLVFSSKMSALGEMAGGVAHEINNPLTIITLTCKNLKTALKAEKIDHSFVDRNIINIEATAERIAKIVKGLRTFSRSDKDRELSATTIKAILDDTLSLCEEKLRMKDIKLEMALEDQTTSFQCNPISISQVILNLLNNSCDAIEVQPERWIRIESKIKEARVEIIITDSGLGIPKDVAHKIMQPFFTTKEVGRGTGLGLSISKGIVESHGGQLIYDVENPHTKFSIQIPYKTVNIQQAV